MADTEPHMRGGWSGNCPVCGVWLQGASSLVVAQHALVAHPDKPVGVATPPPPQRAS